MVKIIDGIIQYGNRDFDCWLGFEQLLINTSDKYELKEDIYIGSDWAAPYASWQPLSFERSILYG
jgi:hypothetical protein